MKINFHVMSNSIGKCVFILDMPCIPAVGNAIYADREYRVEHVDITIPKKSMWHGNNSKFRIDVLISYVGDRKSQWRIR